MLAERIAQLGECLCDFQVLRTVDLAARVECFLQYGDCIGVQPKTVVNRSDRAEQRGARLGLVGEPDADAAGADVEQLARRDLVTAALGRIRQLEKLDQDYDKPFSPPSDIRGQGRLARDHPSKDDTDEDEWYHLGENAASNQPDNQRDDPHHGRRVG